MWCGVVGVCCGSPHSYYHNVAPSIPWPIILNTTFIHINNTGGLESMVLSLATNSTGPCIIEMFRIMVMGLIRMVGDPALLR